MCIGRTPLRQLVYRVLDLPPSLRPLVYDFGQLCTEVEMDYIRQIVSDWCIDIPSIGAEKCYVESIVRVLAWSQKYMREKKVIMIIVLALEC